MKLLSTSILITLLALSTPRSWGQIAATTDVGPLPFHSYSGGTFDHVQVQNGSLWFQVPLVSLQQLGKVALSFSLAGHSASAFPHEACDPIGSSCYRYYADPEQDAETWAYEGGEATYGNVRIQHDQSVSVSSNVVITSASVPTSSGPNNYYTIHKQWSLRDGSGSIHQLGFDSADYSTLHATDGSGWTVKLPLDGSLSEIFDGTSGAGSTIYAYDSDGLKYSLLANTAKVEDSTGNVVTGTAVTSLTNNVVLFGLRDSFGRGMGLPRSAEPSSTEDCPDLGIADQPVTSSALWSVPGPNGGTQTFQICYATLAIRTNYWGGDGGRIVAPSPPAYDDYGNIINQGAEDVWQESSYTEPVIQSVLLPDHKSRPGYSSFWGFVYDTPDTGYSSTYGNVVEIRTPEGGNIHYTYNSLQGCGAGVTGPGNPGYPRISNVVSRVASAGSGPDISTVYSYSATQTTETTGGNDTVHIFTPDDPGAGDSCGASETETKYYQGRSTDGNVIKDVSTNYYSEASPQDDIAYSGPAPLVNVRPHVVTTELAGQAPNTTTYSYEPLFVDIEPLWNGLDWYGYIKPTAIYSVTPTSVDNGVSFTATPSYWSGHPDYKQANMLQLRQAVETQDEQGQTQSKQTFHYDESNGSPSGVNGNVTSIEYWTGPTTDPLTEGAVYNAQGAVTKSVDKRGISTVATEFQCNGLFPSSVTVASGTSVAETSTEIRDCVTGQVTSRTDANGVVTAFDRNDPLGRITKIRAAVGKTEETHTTYVYPVRTRIDVAQDKDVVDDGVLMSSEIYDGLGRISQRIAPGNLVVHNAYDNAGNIASVSNPNYPASGVSDQYTTFLYDALGRKTMQCNQDNGSGTTCSPGVSYKEWIFAGNAVSTRDERGVIWKRTFDSLDRLSAIVEPGGLSTQYGYDPNGNLISVNQAGGSNESPRTRTFTYDSLSRLICSANPETNAGVTCPSTPNVVLPMGAALYTYDGNGNVHSKTDARGVQIVYSYDERNRLLAKSYSNDPSNTLTTCFLYDRYGTAPLDNGLGRMSAEWTQSAEIGECGSSVPPYSATAKIINAYDALGRVLTEKTCISTNCTQSSYHSQSFSYNQAGEVDGFSDGWGLQFFGQHYDTAGRLQLLTSTWTDITHPGILYQVPTYGPFGVVNAKMGANLNIFKGYDNRGRVTCLTTGSTPCQ